MKSLNLPALLVCLIMALCPSAAAAFSNLSPYSYCAGSPINLIDPSGDIPTPKEGAVIADHIYEGKVGERLLGNWVMLREYTVEKNQSFRGGLYGRQDSEGNIVEYAFATAGTYFEATGRGIESIAENFMQPTGASKDMWKSLEVAYDISAEFKDSELTFVGHSKAGAEAAGNALKTNKNALLYNTAAINASAYGLDVSNYKGTDGHGMTVFVVDGEFLNFINNVLGAHPIDKFIVLPKPEDGPINNHSMKSVIKALEQKGYD